MGFQEYILLANNMLMKGIIGTIDGLNDITYRKWVGNVVINGL